MSPSSQALEAPCRHGNELASTMHGMGILLSIGGWITMVAFAALQGNARTAAASAV